MECDEDDLAGLRWHPLKRRLQPDDLLFEDGDVACHLAAKLIPIETPHNIHVNRVAEFPCGVSGCGKVFDTISLYESHYNGQHRNICSVCRRVFPTNHLLEIHILEWHDAMFEILASKQNMYRCLVENCNVMFQSWKHRKKHMVEFHHMPSNYRFDRVQKSKKKENESSKNRKCDKGEDKMEEEEGGGEDVENFDNNMEVEQKKDNPPPKRIFSYKVPNNICFGQGSTRGFNKGRRGRGKHWHQQNAPNKPTTVHIENVVMADLTDALNLS